MPPSRHEMNRMSRRFGEHGIPLVPPPTRQGSDTDSVSGPDDTNSVFAISLWPVKLRYKDYHAETGDSMTWYVPRIRFDSDGMVDHLDYPTLLRPDADGLSPPGHPAHEDLLQTTAEGLNSQNPGCLADQYRLDRETMEPEGILRLMSIILVDSIRANLHTDTTDCDLEEPDQEDTGLQGVWTFGGEGTLSANARWYRLQMGSTQDYQWYLPSGPDDIDRYISFPHTATCRFMLMTDDLTDTHDYGKSNTSKSETMRLEASDIYMIHQIKIDDININIKEKTKDTGQRSSSRDSNSSYELTVLVPREGHTIQDTVREIMGVRT